MKIRTNAIIGLIFLSLLGFVYFYEIKGGEERRKEAEQSKQLLDFKETEVERIELVRGDTTIVLAKGPEGWKINAPLVDRADQEAAERYLRNLAESEREKTVVDSAAATPEQAAQYGLAAPRLEIALGIEDGTEQALAFGADSPTDRFTYVQELGANPEIFVVRAWRFDNLDKSVFDLRDRRVLAFRKDDVVEVRRSGAVGAVVLAREDGDWRVREPIAALADKDAIEDLLDKLNTDEIEAFVAEDPDIEALKGYGFEESTGMEVALLVGDDRAEKRLTIGRDNGQGYYYARDASRPQVFLVDSTLVQELASSVDELRDKKPLRFDRDAVVRIALARGGISEFAADKDTAGVWSLSEPAGRETKSWKLNSLLGDLGQLEVEGFAEVLPGAATEALHIELFGGDQGNLDIRISRVAEAFYLQAGDDGAAYIIGTDAFAGLDLSLDDVAQAAKEPTPAADGG